MAAARSVLASLLLLGTIIAQAQAANSVAELAASDPKFSTVLDLVVKFGLADALGPDFGGTVFVPTNDAFKKIEAVVGTLTPEQIKSVLLYHVAGFYVRNKSFDDEKKVKTLLGQKLELSEKGDDFFVNKIKVEAIARPGKAKVFVIDDVLVPKL